MSNLIRTVRGSKEAEAAMRGEGEFNPEAMLERLKQDNGPAIDKPEPLIVVPSLIYVPTR